MTRTLSCIMLVDDNTGDNFFHERVIKKAGIECDIATFTSAKAAIEALQADEVDPELIFLDINMPGMNGWDFLERYRQLRPHEPARIAVMLSTSLLPADRQRAEADPNVAQFLNKPLSAEALTKILENHFRTRS